VADTCVLDKGMKVLPLMIPSAPSSDSPVRRMKRHITDSRTKEIRYFAKYDPIGAIQSRKEVTKGLHNSVLNTKFTS
jgi:hypothetical protein